MGIINLLDMSENGRGGVGTKNVLHGLKMCSQVLQARDMVVFTSAPQEPEAAAYFKGTN